MTADDRVRGFPAFPPGRRRRAQSWWGGAWVRAMEDTSLDHVLLRKGRRYAHAGHVASITVSPGRIAAAVHDGDEDTPYQTRVFVERFTDAQWTRFLDQVAAKAGHIAALLDGEMPQDLVADADDAGVRLLPGLGDLQPECDCPEWGHPCRHAAALCYQAAWLLDADPFVLLLMRGRGQREVLDELHRRNVPAGDDPSPAPAVTGRPAPGTPAGRAYARPVPPLPAPPPPPGAPPPWPSSVPAGPSSGFAGLGAVVGLAPDGLRLLADNAAARAAQLLARYRAPAPPAADQWPEPIDEWPTDEWDPTDEWPDLVRLASAESDPAVRERLRASAGRPEPEWARAVRAWECGGAAGLDALEHSWSPPRQVRNRARAALDGDLDGAEPGTAPAPPRLWRNRVTWEDRGTQLRYGRDGRWYPYREHRGDWWPAGPGRLDPAAALAELAAAPAE